MSELLFFSVLASVSANRARWVFLATQVFIIMIQPFLIAILHFDWRTIQWGLNLSWHPLTRDVMINLDPIEWFSNPNIFEIFGHLALTYISEICWNNFMYNGWLTLALTQLSKTAEIWQLEVWRSIVLLLYRIIIVICSLSCVLNVCYSG